jgi:hypothetical protein
MIDKIINEWTYQLDSGYPTKDSDYEILRSVLQEINMLSESEIDRTIIQAKGIYEQGESLEINDAQSFEQFIYSEYAMEGQRFLGLPILYEKIEVSPDRNELMSIITDLNKKDLRSGEYEIIGIDAKLYQQVKGGVAGDTIVSDIDVGADGVSLKDYEKMSTVDFGNLSGDTAMLLKLAVNSFEMLTGMQINKSMTRDSINAVLDNLDSDELRNDIRSLIQISIDTEIKVIRRFVDKLQVFMPDGDPERIVENFCSELDKTIRAKLLEVDWWGIISGGKLYLESSDEMDHALKCKNNRVSPAVNNFKGFHLFVNGNRINAAIKDLRAAQTEG